MPIYIELIKNLGKTTLVFVWLVLWSYLSIIFFGGVNPVFILGIPFIISTILIGRLWFKSTYKYTIFATTLISTSLVLLMVGPISTWNDPGEFFALPLALIGASLYGILLGALSNFISKSNTTRNQKIIFYITSFLMADGYLFASVVNYKTPTHGDYSNAPVISALLVPLVVLIIYSGYIIVKDRNHQTDLPQ